MSEKMLVTQALDERDLLVKKIADKIAKASFVDTIKPNEDRVFAKRIDKEEYAKEAFIRNFYGCRYDCSQKQDSWCRCLRRQCGF